MACFIIKMTKHCLEKCLNDKSSFLTVLYNSSAIMWKSSGWPMVGRQTHMKVPILYLAQCGQTSQLKPSLY
jgi:hypothetical protein